MNRPLRKVAVACLLLFAVLLVNANLRQTVLAEGYRDNSSNRRVLERTYERERGAIALSDASRPLVARSVEQDAQFKYRRTYPARDLYAHVTGFYSFLYGASGIERSEDDLLSGEDDELFVERFSDTLTGREPRGGDVVLTLQSAAQQAAFDGLAGKRGAVVALNPKTGAILAMVSAPSYDPNMVSTFDGDAAREYYDRANADPAKPLLNRAISQTYPPGSTFKVITSAAALKGGLTPQSLVASPPTLTLPQTSNPLRNFGGSTCGADRITLADALRISCNTAFAQLALDLGADEMRAQSEAFGIGDRDLKIPLTVSQSRYPADPTPPQLGQTGIGQFDVQVSPLQMAMVASGVANRGQVMKPYLIQEVQAPDLSRLRIAEPEVYRDAVTPAVADQLTAMMEGVVANGSARSAQIDGVRVAGKTGTAQNAPGAAPHAWFIGFAPADDPQVAVAVLVENGGDAGSEATGGRVAAPIARSVLQAVLAGR